MKQFLTLSFILILLACSNQKETTSIKIKPNEHVLIDTVSESKYCYIKSVKQIENEIYIKVDYVEYLTGDQATNQAFKEKAYFIDGVLFPEIGPFENRIRQTRHECFSMNY